MRHASGLTILIVVFVSATVRANGQSPPLSSAPSKDAGPVARPTCALIADKAMGLAGSPLVAMLEVKLSGDKRITLLERGEIDKLIAERELQELFGAEAGSKRSALGALLKADMLLLMRVCPSPDKNTRSLEVIISETVGGLRLSVNTLDWPGEPEQAAERVRILVMRALDELRERIRLIVAVPPFATDDFLYDYSYLRQLYARTLEDLVMASPGTIAVELEEARKITEELQLSGHEATVTRQLPVYVLGHYKTTKADGGFSVSINLTVRQAEKQLFATHREDMTPQQALAFLAENARSVLQRTARRDGAVPDPVAESQQLHERAQLFMRTSEWIEALNLIEAALLLTPDAPQMHCDALQVSRRLTVDVPGVTGYPERKPAVGGLSDQELLSMAEKSFYYMRLSAYHLERFLLLSDLSKPLPREVQQNAGGSLLYRPTGLSVLSPRSDIEKEIAGRSKDHYEQYQQMLWRVLGEKTRRQAICADNVDLLRPHLGHDAESGMALIELIQGVPGVERIILQQFDSIAQYDQGRKEPIQMDESLAWALLDPDVIARVERLAAMRGPSAQNVATALNKLMPRAGPYIDDMQGKCFEQDLKNAMGERRYTFVHHYDGQGRLAARRVEKGKLPESFRAEPPKGPAQPAPQAEPWEVSFPHIELVSEPGTLDWGEAGWFKGWMACNEGVDAAWTGLAIGLMKTKGRLRTVFRVEDATDSPGGPLGDVCYDGRYIWAAVRNVRAPHLVVIDPTTEKVTKLTRDNGMPPMGTDLVVAPLAPGKACVSSAFIETGGDRVQRAWCAVVELDRDIRPTIHMILQGSIAFAPSSSRADSPQSLQYVFVPKHLFATRGPGAGGGAPVVLIRRIVGDPYSSAQALLIRPDQRDARVPSHSGFGSMSIDPARTTIHDGALYMLWRHGGDRDGQLWWIDLARVLSEEGGHPRPADDVLKLIPRHGEPFGDSAAFLSDGQYIHVFGFGSWHIGKHFDGPFRRLRIDEMNKAPPTRHGRICSSNHYGLVLLAQQSMESMASPYAVQIRPGVLDRRDSELGEQLGHPTRARKAAEARRAARIEHAQDELRREPSVGVVWLQDDTFWIWLGVFLSLVFLLIYLRSRARAARGRRAEKEGGRP